jgi:hypothetical protein
MFYSSLPATTDNDFRIESSKNFQRKMFHELNEDRLTNAETKNYERYNENKQENMYDGFRLN